jgi:hypothetical protein
MESTLKGHAIGKAPYMIVELKMIAITERLAQADGAKRGSM